MKRIILIVIVLMLLLCSCAKQSATEVETEFSFRGHEFGDSMEEVTEREAIEPYNTLQDRIDIHDEGFFGYDCSIFYRFENNQLFRLSVYTNSLDSNFDIEVVKKEFLQNFSQYGEPSEIKYDSTGMSIYWTREDYGIKAVIDKGYFIIHMGEIE